MRLKVEKYLLKKKFEHEAHEGDLAVIWKRAPELIDCVDELAYGTASVDWDWDLVSYADPEDHIVNRILAENGVTLEPRQNFYLPDNMSTLIPFETIKTKFAFHSPVPDYRSGPVAAVLDAFFQLHLYKSKLVRDGLQRRHVYKPDKDSLILIQLSPDNIRLRVESEPEGHSGVESADEEVSSE